MKVLASLILLLLVFESCSPKYVCKRRGAVPNIHKPTRKEIKRAMKESTSDYSMPSIRPYVTVYHK